MAVSQADIHAFSDFALQRLSSSVPESLYELVDEWQSQQLSREELERNAAAVQASIDGMEAGDRGRAARAVISEMRSRHNLPDA